MVDRISKRIETCDKRLCVHYSEDTLTFNENGGSGKIHSPICAKCVHWTKYDFYTRL